MSFKVHHHHFFSVGILTHDTQVLLISMVFQLKGPVLHPKACVKMP